LSKSALLLPPLPLCVSDRGALVVVVPPEIAVDADVTRLLFNPPIADDERDESEDDEVNFAVARADVAVFLGGATIEPSSFNQFVLGVRSGGRGDCGGGGVRDGGGWSGE